MIQTRIDPSIKIRKSDDLFDPPVVVYVNKFNEEAAKQFIYDVQRAEQHVQPVVPVVIDSYGGHVYSLLSMVDALAKCKKPVATIAMGKAMSCGSVLLSCGSPGHRYASPNSTVMIHEVSSWAHGKVEELKMSVAETDRLNNLIFTQMAQRCGLHSSYFLDMIHENNHADWFLTPDDCVTHRLVNHIRVPEFSVKVSFDVQFQ